MTLKVIGTGLGRTGTLSMKQALEALGFGPCHHMIEVFGHPESIPLWIAAGQGRPDWDAIFEGYGSVVDYPGASHWRSLIAHYPDAKVLHTQRDPDQWFDSTQATIFSPNRPEGAMPPGMAEFFQSFAGDFAAKMNDRDYMVAHFNRHNAEVVATVPKDRLLVYEAGQGWDPLCEFLGVAVPDAPYPNENSRAAFQARQSSGAHA